MLNGQLVHGAHWSAGEIGHIIVNMDQNARVDSGGHKGTLEAYVSGHGLVATWREITGDRSEITGDAIAVEAKQDLGGPAALAITQTGQYLGIGLVSILSILDPEIVVIGGGLASLGEQLLAPARNVVKARALFGAADCPIVVAELGSSSSIVGAAAVALGKL
jgi:glucokinase